MYFDSSLHLSAYERFLFKTVNFFFSSKRVVLNCSPSCLPFSSPSLSLILLRLSRKVFEYSLTNWLTDSMKQSYSSEANSSSARQKIPRILWSPKVSSPHSQKHHTCPYPESDKCNPWPPKHFLKIHLNIILRSKPGCSKCSPSLRFPNQNSACISSVSHTQYLLSNYLYPD